MKKNNKFMEFLNSKGFYTALFTCLFAVLTIAAFVSIKNIDTLTKLSTYVDEGAESVDKELASTSTQRSKTMSELLEERQKKLDAEKQSPKDATSKKVEEIKEKDVAPKTEEKAGAKADEKGNTEKTPAAPKEAETKDAKAETGEKDVVPKEEAKPEPSASAFTDSDNMRWPIDGTVVMEFSANHAIYDKTLDQYRTNPSICIGADTGTQVKAAATGIVSKISRTDRDGNTIVVDHGNGWQTKYSQLQDAILIKEGEGVVPGQVIGGVADPTKYGVLLGSHLNFEIVKDGVPQDPMVVLK